MECPIEGPRLQTDRDAVELTSAALGCGAGLVAIPARRLGDDFFRLKTRTAGEILQKFLTYRLRVAVVGDISSYLSASAALRDFVRECNRGRHVWFVSDSDELNKRLELDAGES